MVLPNVYGCLCLLFRIAVWMPSMGGGSHVTGPETCGPCCCQIPIWDKTRAVNEQPKLGACPVCWNVTILDTEASWIISGWRSSPGFKHVTDLNFYSRVASLLVGSDVPNRVLSPAFRPVFRQPTNTTIWANLSNTSSQVSHEQCRHVQHVFTICRADSNLPTWSIFLLMPLSTSPFWVSYLFSLFLVPHIPKKIREVCK